MSLRCHVSVWAAPSYFENKSGSELHCEQKKGTNGDLSTSLPAVRVHSWHLDGLTAHLSQRLLPCLSLRRMTRLIKNLCHPNFNTGGKADTTTTATATNTTATTTTATAATAATTAATADTPTTTLN